MTGSIASLSKRLKPYWIIYGPTRKGFFKPENLPPLPAIKDRARQSTASVILGITCQRNRAFCHIIRKEDPKFSKSEEARDLQDRLKYDLSTWNQLLPRELLSPHPTESTVARRELEAEIGGLEKLPPKVPYAMVSVLFWRWVARKSKPNSSAALLQLIKSYSYELDRLQKNSYPPPYGFRSPPAGQPRTMTFGFGREGCRHFDIIASRPTYDNGNKFLYDSLWKSPQFQEFAKREDDFLWSIHPRSEIDILDSHAVAAAEQLPLPQDNSPDAQAKREEYSRVGHIVNPFPGGDHQLAIYNATAGYLCERCPCYRCNPYPFDLLTTRVGNMATRSDYRGRCAEARQWVIAKEREDRLGKNMAHEPKAGG